MIPPNPQRPVPALPADGPTPSSESVVAYEASKTFLARLPDPAVYYLRAVTVGGLLAVFFLVIPLLAQQNIIAAYKVSYLGKYLSFAIVALGVDLIWGYTGLLSLCQALFFCLGGYAMAMHLSLPEGGGQAKVPAFVLFAYYGHANPLPPFWRPFASFPFALSAGILVPGILAAVLGFFLFRSRVRGVYFSIVTQAIVYGMWLLVSRNEMLLGGTNGMTNFSKSFKEDRRWVVGLYLTTLVVLVLSYLLCRAITRSRLGRVLVAIRDKEARLYFAGYRPYAFKVFAFAVAAMLGAVGGMLYVPQVGIITPQDMEIQASILMVIWVALGGRGKLWGAVFGALLVNYTFNTLTSDMTNTWPFILGGMALAVVLYFPDGFVGLWTKLERQVKARAPFADLAATALPLGVTALFVLGEALGKMPGWLQKTVYESPKLGMVRLKYILIVALLALSVIQQVRAKRMLPTGVR